MNEHGIATIPASALAALGCTTLVTFHVSDGDYYASAPVVVTNVDAAGGVHSPFRSLSLARPLDPSKHIVQQQRVAALLPGGVVRVAVASDTKAEDYDSLGKLYSLYCTISGNGTLSGAFSFLPKWAALSVAGGSLRAGFGV